MFTNKETKEVYIGQSKILIPSFQVSKFPTLNNCINFVLFE